MDGGVGGGPGGANCKSAPSSSSSTFMSVLSLLLFNLIFLFGDNKISSMPFNCFFTAERTEDDDVFFFPLLFLLLLLLFFFALFFGVVDFVKPMLRIGVVLPLLLFSFFAGDGDGVFSLLCFGLGRGLWRGLEDFFLIILLKLLLLLLKRFGEGCNGLFLGFPPCSVLPPITIGLPFLLLLLLLLLLIRFGDKAMILLEVDAANGDAFCFVGTIRLLFSFKAPNSFSNFNNSARCLRILANFAARLR